MNERIRKLAEQAFQPINDMATEGIADRYTFEQAWFQMYNQKFAELIVRECISKCEFVADMATITNTGEMARKTKATADSCAKMIKEHFGVDQ